MTARSPKARLVACSNALRELPRVHAATVQSDRSDHKAPCVEAIVGPSSADTVVPPYLLTTIAHYGCGLTAVQPRPTDYLHCDIVALEHPTLATPTPTPTEADTDAAASSSSASATTTPPEQSTAPPTQPPTSALPELPQPELIVAPPTTAHPTTGTTDGACTITRDPTSPPTVMISLASDETTVTADCTLALARHIAQALTDAAAYLTDDQSREPGESGEDTATSTATATTTVSDTDDAGTPNTRSKASREVDRDE